ncbi:hypothetical protein E9549_19255 [Blastococcus sp. MG754426]|uniref:hypothetical protein n=1 Tax=unclassified Blastococcus TaxID=2619396 RepID=UPI001EF04930|nr:MULTISPECIES: hypothetical protein [unclassified Blastococcus]MCF6509522.1 hypothetical protein [Blastococcus sp. MG754426]MCF6512160.1 hypothetical protein [Blastococcus sp. MG754427]
MGSEVLPYVADGGVLFGAAFLLRRCLIAVVALVGTLSTKDYRRDSALKVLRMLRFRLPPDEEASRPH